MLLQLRDPVMAYLAGRLLSSKHSLAALAKPDWRVLEREISPSTSKPLKRQKDVSGCKLRTQVHYSACAELCSLSLLNRTAARIAATLRRLSSNDGNGNKKSLENKHFGNGDYLVIIAFPSHPFVLLTEHAAKWTGRSAVAVNIDNEKFTVICSRCR